MSVREVGFSTALLPPEEPRPAPGGLYQRRLSLVFLLAATLMCSQYTYFKFGPARIFVAPIGHTGPEKIGKEPQYKEGVEPSDVQRAGTYFINWATWDQVAYRLHSVKSKPPAEMLTALLFFLALPLVLVFRDRQLWPRWPQWLFLICACLALLGADKFKDGASTIVQWVLMMFIAYWLAGALIGDAEQARRFGRLLTVLTGVLLLMAAREYLVFVMFHGAAPADPTMVRASLQSRAAYSGLMMMLLAFAGARALGSEEPAARWGWAAVALLGSATLMTLGAVFALYGAAAAMTVAAAPPTERGRRLLLGVLVGLPLAFGLLTLVLGRGPAHWRMLHDSASFYRRDGGVIAGVEKRYLEMGADLNMFNGVHDQTITKKVKKDKDKDAAEPTKPAAEGEDAAGSVGKPVGSRSRTLFGLGPGLNYQGAIGSFYDSLDNPKKQEQDTYNLYLVMACQIGLLGALALAWILWDGAALAHGAWRQLDDPELSALALGLYGALVGVIIYSIWGTLLIRGTGLMLFTLLALAARLAQIGRAVASNPAGRRTLGGEPAS
jgi:hypothetical protein